MKYAIVMLFFHKVNAHGYLSNPPAQFTDSTTKTAANAVADESIDPAFGGLKWDNDPDSNVKTFTGAFKNSKFTSLKNMFDKVGVKCGNSRVDIPAIDVSNMNSMSWQNDEYKEGFTKSHSGPCETWLDDKMVFQNDDCRAAYPKYPAVLPIDYSACSGKCLMEFYWIGLHEAKWQLYKQCAPLVNGKSSTASNKISISIDDSNTVKRFRCSNA